MKTGISYRYSFLKSISRVIIKSRYQDIRNAEEVSKVQLNIVFAYYYILIRYSSEVAAPGSSKAITPTEIDPPARPAPHDLQRGSVGI